MVAEATTTTTPGTPQEVEDHIELTEEEARELENVLENLNRAALEMVERLDRIHWLAQDIIRDLRAARGVGSKENEETHVAT